MRRIKISRYPYHVRVALLEVLNRAAETSTMYVSVDLTKDQENELLTVLRNQRKSRRVLFSKNSKKK
jgi:hypothetical protein